MGQPELRIPGIRLGHFSAMYFNYLPDRSGIIAKKPNNITFRGAAVKEAEGWKTFEAFYEVTFPFSESWEAVVLKVSRVIREGKEVSVRAVIAHEPLPKFEYSSSEYQRLYKEFEHNRDLITVYVREELISSDNLIISTNPEE